MEQDTEKLARDCAKTIDELSTINDAKNIDAATVLQYLALCDRQIARTVITAIQSQLDDIVCNNFNASVVDTLQDDTSITTDKVLFTQVPLHWWQQGTPEQKMLALFTLKSFKTFSYKVLIDEIKNDIVKYDTQHYLITRTDLDALAVSFSDPRYQALESSYQLVVALFEHMSNRTDTTCIDLLRTKPTIINVGGLDFDGGTNKLDDFTTLSLLSLEHANFTHFRFVRCKIEKNHFDASLLDDCYFFKCEVQNNTFSNTHMEYATMRAHRTGQDTTNTSRFKMTNWTQNKFDGATIIYVDFNGKKNSSSNLTKSSIQGATLIDCDFTRVELPSDLNATRLLNCVFDNASIRNGKFENGDLRGSTFIETTFQSIADDTVFRQTNLTGVDFSKSHFSSQYRGKIVVQDCLILDAILPVELQQRLSTLIQLARSPNHIDSLEHAINSIEQKRNKNVPENVYNAARETLIRIIQNTKDLSTMLHILDQLGKSQHWQRSYDVHYEACKQFLDIVMNPRLTMISIDYLGFLLDYFKQYNLHVWRHTKQPHQLKRLKYYIGINVLLFNRSPKVPAPKPVPESTWEIAHTARKKPQIHIHEIIRGNGIGL